MDGLKKLQMKAAMTLLLGLFVFAVSAQNNIYRFEATKVNLNNKGEKIQTSTTKPSVITVNLADQTVTVETTSPEITELLRGQMGRKIEKQLGDISNQYSFLLEGNIFAHFYLDRLMIIFTRNDVHPLEWGIQFMEIQKVE